VPGRPYRGLRSVINTFRFMPGPGEIVSQRASLSSVAAAPRDEDIARRLEQKRLGDQEVVVALTLSRRPLLADGVSQTRAHGCVVRHKRVNGFPVSRGFNPLLRSWRSDAATPTDCSSVMQKDARTFISPHFHVRTYCQSCWFASAELSPNSVAIHRDGGKSTSHGCWVLVG